MIILAKSDITGPMQSVDCTAICGFNLNLIQHAPKGIVENYVVLPSVSQSVIIPTHPVFALPENIECIHWCG
jgi:hypothetical protein